MYLSDDSGGEAYRITGQAMIAGSLRDDIEPVMDAPFIGWRFFGALFQATLSMAGH